MSRFKSPVYKMKVHSLHLNCCIPLSKSKINQPEIRVLINNDITRCWVSVYDTSRMKSCYDLAEPMTELFELLTRNLSSELFELLPSDEVHHDCTGRVVY